MMVDRRTAGHLASQSPQRPMIGRVIIGVEHKRLIVQHPDQGFEQPGHALLDRLGIGSAEDALELCALLLLPRRHAATAAERRVGEVIEHPALGTHSEVRVEGEVLRELEGLEAVDDECFVDLEVLEDIALEEQALASQAGDVSGNGTMMDAENPGRLAEGSALRDEAGDGDEQFRISQPISDVEGRSGKTSSAMTAEVVLDAPAVAFANVGTISDEVPVGLRDVEITGGIRAAGGLEATGLAECVSARRAHTQARAARLVPTSRPMSKRSSVPLEGTGFGQVETDRSRFFAPQSLACGGTATEPARARGEDCGGACRTQEALAAT